MNCFEETAQVKQPYAAVDSPPVIPYDEIESSMEDYLEDHARSFTRDIYEHWKARRVEAGNKPLREGLKVIPSPKTLYIDADLSQLETGADTDDADPYVCFRRREVRQIRKTRGRDAHSAEKLKKLRKELEEARELLQMVKQREVVKRDQLAADRELFEQRSSLRQVKLNLPDPYKEGDEDLLINQKVRCPVVIAIRQCGILIRAIAKEEASRNSMRTQWTTEFTPEIRWQTCRSRPCTFVGRFSRTRATGF